MLANILAATGALVAIAVAAVLVLAARKPDVFRMERSALVQAPPARIFPLIEDLRAFARWSPYEKKDPDMQRAHEGPPAGPGAAYRWAGDRNVGRGRLSVVETEAPTRVEMLLEMEAPMKAANRIAFTLTPEAGGTRVTWAMTGETPFFCKVLQTLFDMEKLCGRDFEAGLGALKFLVEGTTAPAPSEAGGVGTPAPANAT